MSTPKKIPNGLPVNFAYKPSILRNTLLFNMPHQPRLDWQMSNSAYSQNVESEHYLVLLLGKICEKNPVILDLLGYRIHEKENFYKCNFKLNQCLLLIISYLRNISPEIH